MATSIKRKALDQVIKYLKENPTYYDENRNLFESFRGEISKELELNLKNKRDKLEGRKNYWTDCQFVMSYIYISTHSRPSNKGIETFAGLKDTLEQKAYWLICKLVIDKRVDAKTLGELCANWGVYKNFNKSWEFYIDLKKTGYEVW